MDDWMMSSVLNNQVNFLLADLDTGLAFVDIGETSDDEEMRRRDFLNARHAYDTVLQLMQKATLDDVQNEAIRKKLTLLSLNRSIFKHQSTARLIRSILLGVRTGWIPTRTARKTIMGVPLSCRGTSCHNTVGPGRKAACGSNEPIHHYRWRWPAYPRFSWV